MSECNLISKTLIKLTTNLNTSLRRLNFENPISYVYNPAVYAIKPYTSYINKFCNDPKQILFVGMNPGPYGMCQTGVPFGEISHVLNWLRIKEDVSLPEVTCPSKPVRGFACTTSEQSGLRFWGLFKGLCKEPSKFFENAFVFNYCPLAFFDERGRNITPSEINTSVRDDLEDLCDEMLCEVIRVLKPKYLVGIGRYAEKRCEVVKKRMCLDYDVLYLVHPSPRVFGNTEWEYKAKEFLISNHLMQFFTNS